MDWLLLLCDRLLEKDDLTLEAAFEQAYSLERAQQQSSSYSINVAASNVLLRHQRSANSLAGADIGSAHDLVPIGVREGILLGGRKKFALKVTFLVNPNGA